ncbi:uracil-xanthine permease family protein [Marinobacterium weihaiense]|uniref:Uracil-xanthine permease family protein n=1 Tax=Marinobacterium weihaiense TaxID=2851016 RepID=A0ABS6MC86_9GAMM|nr:uracil-xanthine permease family protein [Marinobacterium weihaiense]MBV0933499.1 uracil-xanthine permease family protein [Marinobacterium weihaiense]
MQNVQQGAFHWRTALAGSQMLFVAFGALVLMPLLTGLNPSVALFTAGVGTLMFHLVTGLSVPIFLASSFVFIAPITYSVSNWGVSATMGGLMAAGGVYMLLSLGVRLKGVGFLHRLMPPVVTGPVIMIIGLGMAPLAVNMAMGKTGDGSEVLFAYDQAMLVSMSALVTTLVVAVFARGIFRLLPILSGVIVGYIAAYFTNMVDFAPINAARWVAMPEFVAPSFHWQAILFMIPVALAPAIEHVGDILAISNVTGKDYMRRPGLHRTLLGDGVATAAAACFGGPPNTTYSEVTGAVMLTKSFNPVVMVWAAIVAIALAFIAKFGVALQTIPSPVMGGILILLFGSIAAVGMNTLIKAHVDLAEQRNLVIVATTLVFGIGGMALGQGDLSLQGVSLCGAVAIILNLILPNSEPVDNDLHEEQDVINDLVDHGR